MSVVQTLIFLEKGDQLLTFAVADAYILLLLIIQQYQVNSCIDVKQISLQKEKRKSETQGIQKGPILRRYLHNSTIDPMTWDKTTTSLLPSHKAFYKRTPCVGLWDMFNQMSKLGFSFIKQSFKPTPSTKT